MTNARNRRREGSALKRMATRVTAIFRRPSNSASLQGSQDKPKKTRTRRRVSQTNTGLLKTKSNRRRENPLLVLLLWRLPISAALMAFATPFLGARAYEYLMSTGHFMVRDVMVGGAHHLEQPEILQLAGIRPGTHVLATDLKAMARKIESHPWVANAMVERELPDRLIVSIDEHRPVAHIVLERMWLVNASGEPFSEATRGVTLPLPIITGVDGSAFSGSHDTSEA